MQTVESYDRQIERLRAKIAPLQRQIGELVDARDELASRQWIAENGVLLEDVERLTWDKPYFASIQQFADWLRENSIKPWCEWNGTIYSTFEIRKGIMRNDAPGRVRHLEGK